MRIEPDQELGKYYACWYYDDKDPDEATIVLDIKKVYVITDPDGNIIQNCLTHGAGSLHHLRRHRRRSPRRFKAQVQRGRWLAKKAVASSSGEAQDSDGERYQIRSGLVYAEDTARRSMSPSACRWRRTRKSSANSRWSMSPSFPAR